MVLIARVIAEPATLADRLEASRGAFGEAGLRLAGATMLEFCSDVLELDFAAGADGHDDAGALRTVLDAHFAPADGLIVSADPQVPHVFVSDMDSTMIAAECIDELADFAGIKPQIAAITERAMNGELDFAAALVERVGLLRDLPAAAIEQCLAERIALMPGARTLVATLKARGCRTVLVTGGFHQFADPIAELLGFDRVVANRLAIAGGRLTGALDGPIADSATKRATLLEEVAGLGEGAVSLAMGDGANDIPMLESATCGIAYRAKPRARAAAHGWIDRGDCTSVLALLGIARDDWLWE